MILIFSSVPLSKFLLRSQGLEFLQVLLGVDQVVTARDHRVFVGKLVQTADLIESQSSCHVDYYLIHVYSLLLLSFDLVSDPPNRLAKPSIVVIDSQ